jgi:hypothetical protein
LHGKARPTDDPLCKLAREAAKHTLKATPLVRGALLSIASGSAASATVPVQSVHVTCSAVRICLKKATHKRCTEFGIL